MISLLNAVEMQSRFHFFNFFTKKKVLVALPYRSRSFYLITFYGGDHVEFTVKDFPEMIHEVIWPKI